MDEHCLDWIESGAIESSTFHNETIHVMPLIGNDSLPKSVLCQTGTKVNTRHMTRLVNASENNEIEATKQKLRNMRNPEPSHLGHKSRFEFRTLKNLPIGIITEAISSHRQ